MAINNLTLGEVLTKLARTRSPNKFYTESEAALKGAKLLKRSLVGFFGSKARLSHSSLVARCLKLGIASSREEMEERLPLIIDTEIKYGFDDYLKITSAKNSSGEPGYAITTYGHFCGE